MKTMKVLLVGVGGVGEAIATAARDRPWLGQMVLGDRSLRRAREVQRKLARPRVFPAVQLDASSPRSIAKVAREHGADLVMNAVSNVYNNAVFDGAYRAACHYVDMAMSDSGANMGRYQFERSQAWSRKGLLALLGMGADPGMSDVFAKYAEKHLFDEIDEIGVRDGAALEVRNYEFAPTFSIVDTIEECTDPALIWERDRGWHTTEPFSDPEIFNFPEGIGPLECRNVEHEEVVLIPRWIRCRRVTFKYALDEKFINAIRVIKRLGLDRPQPIQVGQVKVAPRDVVVACLPDPARLGSEMTGRTCVGTWVKGQKNGEPWSVYLYQVTDNAESMAKHGCQAVSWQTGVCAAIAMDLIANGIWRGSGVLGPEALDPDPFLERMRTYDFPYGMKEMS